MTMGQAEVSSSTNHPGNSPKTGQLRLLLWFLAIGHVLFFGAVAGVMGAMQRGPHEGISGIIPGIVAMILGLGAFFLGLGRIEPPFIMYGLLAAVFHASLAGRSESITSAFYFLPVPLVYGFITRVFFAAFEGRPKCRVEGKTPSRAGSSGLWDREMDGNRP